MAAVTSSAPAADPGRDEPVIRRARVVLDDALDEVAGWLLDRSGEVVVIEKDDGTPVSESDREVDDRLRARLATAFPDHGVLSEERDTVSPSTRWTWVIDPVDGTSNYVNRVPYWCISVALLRDGAPVLGVVDAPVLGRRYVAVKGQGAEVVSRSASLDGAQQRPRSRPLQVRAPVDWREGRNGHIPLMLTTGTARRAPRAGIALNLRVMGSTALDLALVAEGVAAASIAVVPKVWDIAAGVLLVEEAGGVALTIEGEPLLPLPQDQEQDGRAAMTIAGPDAHYVRELATALFG